MLRVLERALRWVNDMLGPGRWVAVCETAELGPAVGWWVMSGMSFSASFLVGLDIAASVPESLGFPQSYCENQTAQKLECFKYRA